MASFLGLFRAVKQKRKKKKRQQAVEINLAICTFYSPFCHSLLELQQFKPLPP